MWIKDDFELHELRYRDLDKEKYGSWTNYSQDELKNIKIALEKIIKKINTALEGKDGKEKRRGSKRFKS